MIEPDIQTIWVWSDMDFRLIKRIQITLLIKGNLGTTLDSEGPICIDNFSDFHECWEVLKERLYKRLNSNLSKE